MKIRNLIVFMSFPVLTGCDCQYEISGIVLDKMTKKPVPNVAIGKTDTTNLDNPFNRKSFTTESGEYEVNGIAGRCNEVTLFFSKDGYQRQKVTFPNNSEDTILLEQVSKQQVAIFDFKEELEILEIIKSNDYPSSDKDITVCTDWTLNKLEIKHIINEAQPISGPEWHHLFGHFPCRLHGKLLQGSNEFEYSINSGSWFTVTSSDTTLRFGSFREENSKYFLSKAWTEEEMEEKKN